MLIDGQLDRREVVAELMRGRSDLIVVAGLGSSAYDLMAAGDHERNVYLWGAMGGAAMIGLGLAQAQPDIPIAVLTGDGEQLMGLGALATIAAVNPANLTIVVLDNGQYGETGQQASHSGMGLALHSVAAACGFTYAQNITGAEQLQGLSQRLHKPDCLGFARVQVHPEAPARVLPSRDGRFNKDRVRAALGIDLNL